MMGGQTDTGHIRRWHHIGRLAFVAALVIVASVDALWAQSNPRNVTLSGTRSSLPYREFATRELGDAWDMNERTDVGWFTWGVDSPPHNLTAKGMATDTVGNTVFSATAKVITTPDGTKYGDPSVFLLDTWLPGGGKLGKVGANYPIDTTVYNTLYLRMKVDRSVLSTIPKVQVMWSRNTIYPELPDGGAIRAWGDHYPGAVTSAPDGVFFNSLAAEPYGRLEGGQWLIVRIPLTVEGMRAINPWIDRWRNANTGATVEWGAPGVVADSLKIIPFHIDPDLVGGFQIDWARLVSETPGNTTTVAWTPDPAYSGKYDVVVSTKADCSDYAVLAYGAASPMTFQSQMLPPGTYRVGLRKPFTRTGHTSDPNVLASCSADTFDVKTLPSLTVTSPHPEGSADDFATNVLRNPWDFDALTDIDYPRNANMPDASYGIVNRQATDLAGNDLGTVRVFRNLSTQVCPVPLCIGDPYVHLLWPIPSPPAPVGTRARGEHIRIDASRYRIVTAEVGVERSRDLDKGSVARIIWHVDGDHKVDSNYPVEIESSDIHLRHLDPSENGGKITLETIQVDMADRESLPIESDSTQWASGWNNTCVPTPGAATCVTTASNYRPGISSFRFDFHEFSDATPSEVRRVKLAALERTGNSFAVRWNTSNPSNLAATVTLKAVPEADPARHNRRPLDPTCQTGATTIATGLTFSSGSYTWSPASTPGLTVGAEYFVCAQIVVGGTVVDEELSRWPVVVTPQVSELLTSLPGLLRFTATKNSDNIVAVTADQKVTVSGPAVAWTATANRPWIRITGGSGVGAGGFTVGIQNPDNVIGNDHTTLGAIITITSSVPGMIPLSLPVSLVVDMGAGANTVAPFGVVDTPSQNASGIQGTLGITGWVLDDVGVASVKLYRSCLPFEPSANCQMVASRNVAYVGDATIISGARPDVETVFYTYPQANHSAWGYLLMTNLLPHVPKAQMFGGQGAVTFHVLATDVEGRVTWLGRTTADATPTTFTMDNDSIAKPFGAIDTPGQGALVSGYMANFGWALTPDRDTEQAADGIIVPTAGSSMWVFIDGVPRGTVTFGLCRGTDTGYPYCNDDVSSIFGNPTPQAVFTPRTSNPTRFRNLDAGRGAIGYFGFDTTTLANGVHTIMWGVTDNAGRGEGIGSRYFTVLNAGGRFAPDGDMARADARPGSTEDLASLPVSTAVVTGRVGIDLDAPLRPLRADADGARRVRLATMGRLELAIPGATTGWWIANGLQRDLPTGSALDAETGVFTWAPGPGFLGSYRLVFVTADGQVPVDVTIDASLQQADEAVRMSLDTPVQGAAVSGGLLVAGWALDPLAAIGSGIDAVHVWAERLDAPGSPVFLGAAALDGARPDVAARHGRQFDRAGFSLTASGLAPGLYNVTAYVWSARTMRWEEARSAAVTVR